MCTVITQLSGEGRFWVAANRDEVLVRPASGPRRWPGEQFVAPRDEAGGGSWLGLTARGLFVAVTNRFGAPKDEARESRGHLVLEALRQNSPSALHAWLGTLSPERFNPFHLFYSDGVEGFISWSDGARLHSQPLLPGLHVLTERSFGASLTVPAPMPAADEPERARFIRERLAELGPTPTAEQLQALLGIHRPEAPLDSPCVHVPDFGYGTRSSLVLFKQQQVEDSDWRWAEGPPDRTPFVAHRFGNLLHPEAAHR